MFLLNVTQVIADDLCREDFFFNFEAAKSDGQFADIMLWHKWNKNINHHILWERGGVCIVYVNGIIPLRHLILGLFNRPCVARDVPQKATRS